MIPSSGSSCAKVGQIVASKTRAHRFESTRRQFLFTDEDVLNPEEVDGFAVDVDELLSAERIAADPVVPPVHPQRRLERQKLSFLVDFHDVAKIQRNVDLKPMSWTNLRLV